MQADLLGFYNLQRAGWSPDGMVDLFKHFGERATGIESLMAISESHPAPADREQQMTNEMKKFPPKAGLTRDSAEFKAVQAELKSLPRPRSPAPSDPRCFNALQYGTPSTGVPCRESTDVGDSRRGAGHVCRRRRSQ